MTENLLTSPALSGIMLESPEYRVLGVGLSDRVCLIGHSDGLTLNDPYLVKSVRETVNKLEANGDSPLFKGFMQALQSGCKDIWLMAAAPMSEWVPSNEDRTEFYPQWAERLAVAYDILLKYDAPQYIVPLHAPINETDTDFLTPLAQHCSAGFDTTGAIRIGLIGSQFDLNIENIQALAEDPRLNQGAAGKFVVPVLGEGVFNPQESVVSYVDPLPAIISGMLSQLHLNRTLTYSRIPRVVGVTGLQLKQAEIKFASEAKLNVPTRTQLGKRGRPFQVVMATDNTLAADGSDYWSLQQLRLVSYVINSLREIGRRFLGTIGYGSFKHDCLTFMMGLSSNNIVRNYTLDIRRADPSLDPQDLTKVMVDVTIQPYFSIRQISFTTRVGPAI